MRGFVTWMLVMLHFVLMGMQWAAPSESDVLDPIAAGSSGSGFGGVISTWGNLSDEARTRVLDSLLVAMQDKRGFRETFYEDHQYRSFLHLVSRFYSEECGDGVLLIAIEKFMAAAGLYSYPAKWEMFGVLCNEYMLHPPDSAASKEQTRKWRRMAILLTVVSRLDYLWANWEYIEDAGADSANSSKWTCADYLENCKAYFERKDSLPIGRKLDILVALGDFLLCDKGVRGRTCQVDGSDLELMLQDIRRSLLLRNVPNGQVRRSQPLKGEYSYFEFSFACKNAVHGDRLSFIVPATVRDSFFPALIDGNEECGTIFLGIVASDRCMLRAEKHLDPMGIAWPAFGKSYAGQDSSFYAWYKKMVPTEEIDAFFDSLRTRLFPSPGVIALKGPGYDLLSVNLQIEGETFSHGSRKYVILQKVSVAPCNGNWSNAEAMIELRDKIIGDNVKKLKPGMR